jgi:peroxiredoxin
VSLFLLLLISVFSITANPVVAKTEAPDFTLADIYGTEFSLSDYQGKVVIIDFFRVQPPCPGCLIEIPHLKSVYNKYSQDDVIIMSISVSSSDTDGILKDFALEQSMEWIVALGTNQIAMEYEIQYVPSLFIVDTEGHVAHGPLVGETPSSELITKIEPLLSVGQNGDSNGQPNGDSGEAQPGMSLELVGIIGVAVVFFLIIGIVAAGRVLEWSKPAKMRGRGS